jgi:hypothetical protein
MRRFKPQPWLLALLLAGFSPLPILQRTAVADEAAGRWTVGERVLVLWKGHWYKAVVIGVKPGLSKLNYDGYADSWDEWVGPERIRAIAAPPPVSAEWTAGDRVEVLWKRSWYKATIIGVKPGLYRIHYTGYASSWDEWVAPGRIRVPR